MQEIALCFSILLSGFIIGFGGLMFAELREVKELYKKKMVEVDQLMKVASEANLSITSKILDLEQQLSTMEFWRSSVLKGK